ncbi:6-bladed beta-propeller protein [Chitinophaga polysaccharea]|uniref:6-bladed beta-propeller protein n=1 Tax=Chitinophaga polysaccharea TaxID=1293035 RepID=A0A561P744_9BACT|nr:6-bladed beta-propeller [Chitinophaga polysaccharea]TWF33939.1 6-bladed beta-propeller protein [Chitinophaga polysaccharea]
MNRAVITFSFIKPIGRSIFFFLWVLPIAMILFSCSSNERAEITDNYVELHIDNSSISDTLDISSIVDSVELLKLANVPNKQIGYIGQLYALEDAYVVVDPISTKRINAYKSNGDYLKTIMENGVSDSNALNITDCYVNERKEVIVYDYAQMKLTIFDSDLKRKKDIKGGNLFHYNHIASIPGSDNFVGYASYNNSNAYLQTGRRSPSSLDLLSDTLSLVRKYLRYSKKFENIAAITFDKSFFAFRDSLRFFRAYDPYVYSINKSEVERRYKIIYSKGNFPSDFLESVIRPHLSNVKINGHKMSSLKSIYLYCNGYTSQKNWLESDSLIYLSSISFKEQGTVGFGSLVVKGKGTAGTLVARNFVDAKKFKVSFPEFSEYDSKSNQFIAFCTGNELKRRLYNDSPLRKKMDIIDDCFYLVKVRLHVKDSH